MTSAKTSNAALRRQIAEKAHQCARWARINGFEVLNVMGGMRQPRVIIKPSPLCATLEGSVQGYERTAKGERWYGYAVRFDCMLEWDDIYLSSRHMLQQERAYKAATNVLTRLLGRLRTAIGGMA